MQRSLIAALVVVVLIALCSACATAPPAFPPAVPSVDAALVCASNADCTVKDVGSCCGYYPQCVNVAHQTNPSAVKAACAAESRSSICGFPEIAGCRCVEGHCRASDSTANPN